MLYCFHIKKNCCKCIFLYLEEGISSSRFQNHFTPPSLQWSRAGVPNPQDTDQAAQQEASGGWASEASSVFTAAPHRSHYHLSSTSCQHYGELYNHFIIYYSVIIIEIKCTMNIMHLNHPKTITPPHPGPWKNCLPQNRSLVPKRLGTAGLESANYCWWVQCDLWPVFLEEWLLHF